ncbi:S-adenosyl-L-methionine:benzoic acid/salicylic acid carboxyl methyltransferase 1-like [Prosopis cineraria]|uniref:S-adenosyl-L-methionine:benzoic acid/salicylic acid carboxyl methyltransferase 1-like n=1 Tax=Prosopis cineraria TaxID=364024 RepID=UPI00240F96DD|nr:S-adenosyl-L-methionine:benzoic acid/salicylic acid carboxyl methyltransferase 1-like [Prosopis cineraria]
MDVAQVLHMKGGTTETSYSNNSLFQQKVISSTKPIREDAIACFYREANPRSLAIADLGCSSGPNTFSVSFDLIETVEKLCRDRNQESPEYMIFLNDLPSNDFNTIFKSFESFEQKVSKEVVGGSGPCYITGVPGSFYGRILPTKSLHFVHCSYSLHWMSQVPRGVENNKGNIYMTSKSPLNVCTAYYHQFQSDFSMFLKCRAHELVEGGRMVLTLLGRGNHDSSMNKYCHIWDIVAEALNVMVLEGIIKEDQMDSFNVPFYSPSSSELKLEVVKEGSFTINYLEEFETSWEVAYDEKRNGSKDYQLTQFMRAVVEPLLVSHFREAITDHLFWYCQQILACHMSKGNLVHLSLSISLTRTS